MVAGGYCCLLFLMFVGDFAYGFVGILCFSGLVGCSVLLMRFVGSCLLQFLIAWFAGFGCEIFVR